MPEEIFSKKNWMADDGGLAKTLFYDLVRKLQVPPAAMLPTVMIG